MTFDLFGQYDAYEGTVHFVQPKGHHFNDGEIEAILAKSYQGWWECRKAGTYIHPFITFLLEVDKRFAIGHGIAIVNLKAGETSSNVSISYK